MLILATNFTIWCIHIGLLQTSKFEHEKNVLTKKNYYFVFKTPNFRISTMLRLQTKSQNAIRSVQSVSAKITEKSNKILERVDDKVKGTFVEKWLKYWKTVYTDYREVALEVKKDIKQKPLKALILGTTFTGLYFSAKHNPDGVSFRDAYLKAANEILLVHPSCQRKEAVEHLKNIEIYYNNHTIRRLNCGVASIMWIDDFSDECSTFEAQCSYLKLQYSKFTSRILDVGFLDNWWILSNKMIDYDINY